MDENKNLFIAIILMMTLLLGYQLYISSTARPKTDETLDSAKQETRNSPTDKETFPEVSDKQENSQQFTAPVEIEVSANKGSRKAESIEIETDFAFISLSTKGGMITSYKLKNYKDSNKDLVNLIPSSDGDTLGSPAVLFPSKDFSEKINRSIFKIAENKKSADLLEISFTLSDESQVTIEKRYRFYTNRYDFDFVISVTTDPKWGDFDYSVIFRGLGDENSASGRSMTIGSYIGPVLMLKKERIKDQPDEDKPFISYKNEDIEWVALTNRYYAAILKPLDQVKRREVQTSYKADYLYYVGFDALSTKSAVSNFNIYLGPKDHKILASYPQQVSSIINYGIFDIIAKPTFVLLRWFESYIGNWGWSIILLTILVKIIFFPLSSISLKSMRKMQKLQPQLKRIQELYKDDREQMNAALMKLYKENKVNPLGGCLPMLLQIPIFIALYNVLLESIELKGAPWIFWITDLSVKDPYYITPILMGCSMLLQQWMTPSTGDPTQRKMMMILPVVFTFLFLSFPSGLVIYWFVNNLLTIAQQVVVNMEKPAES